jgi:hypothetical protein
MRVTCWFIAGTSYVNPHQDLRLIFDDSGLERLAWAPPGSHQRRIRSGGSRSHILTATWPNSRGAFQRRWPAGSFNRHAVHERVRSWHHGTDAAGAGRAGDSVGTAVTRGQHERRATEASCRPGLAGRGETSSMRGLFVGRIARRAAAQLPADSEVRDRSQHTPPRGAAE